MRNHTRRKLPFLFINVCELDRLCMAERKQNTQAIFCRNPHGKRSLRRSTADYEDVNWTEVSQEVPLLLKCLWIHEKKHME